MRKSFLSALVAGLFSQVSYQSMTQAAIAPRRPRTFNKVSGERNRSKWSLQDLRDIRARNGVGRPPSVIAARRGPAGL